MADMWQSIDPNSSMVTGGQGGGWGFGNFLSGINNSQIMQNPEQLAIALDMVGKGLSPNNPMAGIGMAMGQSSLANKANQARAKEDAEYRKALLGALSGGLSGPTNTPIPTNHTPAGSPGPTSTTITGTPDGQNEVVTKSTVPNAALQQGAPGTIAKGNQRLTPGDFISIPF